MQLQLESENADLRAQIKKLTPSHAKRAMTRVGAEIMRDLMDMEVHVDSPAKRIKWEPAIVEIMCELADE